MHFSAVPARRGHSASRGGNSLHLIASAQRAGTYLQKIQKFRGRIAILEKLGFCNPNSRRRALFLGPRVFAISTKLQAESRQVQNMKVVRLELTNHPEVESRRTNQQGRRKAAKKTTGSGFSGRNRGWTPAQISPIPGRIRSGRSKRSCSKNQDQ